MFNVQSYSVSLENISCIYLLLNIIQFLVVAIGNNGITLLFKLFQVIHNTRPEERLTILSANTGTGSCFIRITAIIPYVIHIFIVLFPYVISTCLLTTTTLYQIQFKKHIYMLNNGSEWFAKVVRYFGCIITFVSLYKLKGLFLGIV